LWDNLWLIWKVYSFSAYHPLFLHKLQHTWF
jgi:hypothetical protein